MTPNDTAILYPQHLDEMLRRAALALERVGRSHLLVAAGAPKYGFLDDRPYPFQPNPHFLSWVPLASHPFCWLAVTPGERPRLVYFQPDDYWHLPPEDPSGYWAGQFDIRIIRDPAEAAAELPPPAQSAIIGEADAAIGEHVPDNPQAVLDLLHWHRARKTPYELAQMRAAQRRAVPGHRAAEAAFRDGASELDIHRAYLAATRHGDLDLPYGSIVALNRHGATLHYQLQQPDPPQQSRSLLIDAGASVAGYASDITRTWGDGDARFQALVDGVDALQQQLAAGLRPGRSYVELHLEAHLRLAGLLRELGVVDMEPESMVDSGVSAAFFPHGLGHLIGLQVHDVGGQQRGEDGGRLAPPEAHPFLRLTRTLEPGMVATVEPGIYFNDTLMAGLRAGAHGGDVDWDAVEHLAQFGGVRIEDEVLCTDTGAENLTREAFAEAA